MSWWVIAIIAVAVVYVIVKRFVGEPLNIRDLLAPPLILTVLGVRELMAASELSSTDQAWLAGSLAVGVAGGALRGATVRLFERDGALWQRYTGLTVLAWVGSLAAGAGFDAFAVWGGMVDTARPMTLAIGVGLVGEAAVVGLRGMRSGRPFSVDRSDSMAGHQAVVDAMGRALRRGGVTTRSVRRLR